MLTAPPSVTPPPSAPTPLSTSAPPTDDSGKTPPPATATPAPDQPTPSPVPPPTNDDMGRALAIGSLPASHSLDTAGATTAVGDPDCDGTGPTVWFSFRPSTSMTVAATTFGSDYDTTLYAGTRSPSGGFEMLACNDDAGQNLQSALRLNVAANHTYLFMVGSYGGWESGQLVFNLQVAPLQPVVTLTLAEQGTFDTQGRATLSGTAACSSRIDGLYLEISLRQRVGRQVFRGWGESALERCGTRTRSWSALIHPDEGTFGDEPATANVYARYCDDFECRSVAFEQQVTLSSTEPPPSPSPSPAPATPSTAPEQTPMTEPSTEPDE